MKNKQIGNMPLSVVFPHLQEIAIQYGLRLNRAKEFACARRIFCVQFLQFSVHE